MTETMSMNRQVQAADSAITTPKAKAWGESMNNPSQDEFKTRLVNDVFGKDNDGKVPMEKVMLLIWKFRDDPVVVQFMAQFVTKYSGRRDVFDGIEFYLPQLAHMIIHLEASWDDAILERFALIIAQHSIHFALQFNWILQAAIEDYQPESSNGEPNESYNALFYTRCVKLLANIERCVVYGTPRTHELQRLYEKGQITKDEYDLLEQADRTYNAAQLTNERITDTLIDTAKKGLFGGALLYKRLFRTSRCKRKPWKTRYFAVSERMLYCYNEEPSLGGRLVRAMPLEGAMIMKTPATDAKYLHMFDVHNINYFFQMRAKDEEDREMWIQTLKEERDSHNTLYPHQLSREHSTSEEDSDGLPTHEQQQFMKDLTTVQKARYDFFKNEREFVRSLTKIAEDLRMQTPAMRKELAPTLVERMDTPPCIYVPLCNSTDVWRRVQTSISTETRVFNTKERCPVVMCILTRRGEVMHHHRNGLKDVNLDVAEFLHLQYEIPDAMHTIAEGKVEQNGDGPTKMSAESQNMLWNDKEEGVKAADPSNKESAELKGNAQLRRLIKDNLVRIPSKIKAGLSHRTPRSKRSFDLPLQSVPILEHRSGEDVSVSESASVVSEMSGTMMTAEGLLQIGNEKDGIDSASLDRASKIICRGESWTNKTERLLRESYDLGYMDNDASTEVMSFMIKSNDDLRQEVFVMQLIHFYKSVFAKASLPIWLKTYRLLSTSQDTGLLEFLTDTISIDALKKSESFPVRGGLKAYFDMVYGLPDSESFKAAQRNFMLSLVGYSLVSYLLGLKDRHNGNIMIDVRGRLIHIDFGFAMGMAPGHEFHMERAPFKLTQDYIDVMDGLNSECFTEFKRLFVAGFIAARANSQIALGLVEIMMYKSNYPCFSGPRYGNNAAIIGFENRLMLRTPDKDIKRKILNLIQKSISNTGTYVYDKFQYMSNGYMM